jgi:hypothetical protein
MKKILFFSVLFVYYFIPNTFAQQNEDSHSKGVIIERFQEFFENEIKRQGVKRNWIFRLEEITGVHKFDFDDDGFMDSLLEFQAVPVEGGGITNHYVVLFRNLQDKDMTFLNYTASDGLRFERFEKPFFYFKEFGTSDTEIRHLFRWEANKFLKVK